MKRLLAVSLSVIALSACGSGTTTIIREVPASTTIAVENTAPEKQEESSEVIRMSIREAINYVRTSTSGLWEYSDEEIASLMATACDTIDEWAPDYKGYLANAREALTGEGTSMRSDIAAIMLGGLYAYCSYHQEGMFKALENTDGSGSF